ncbi:Pr6Pr family membrane protein [Naasia sp. SYSU D00948]|uniref:Pr6Pr family membrane protein n=1 Tax=Naasia sp. SYSU D00948 TaxID=2817379 RepID=UPI001B317C76|nr:Pr6Pr family membrane protein [Naasia sp. SYSU D00948]
MTASGTSTDLLARDARPVLDHDNAAVRVLRVVLGLLGFGTVIANMFIIAAEPEGLDAVNYLSYFTNQSSLYAGAVLAVSGLLPRSRLPRWWDGWRGAAAVYAAVTLAVFALLLEGTPAAGETTPWVDLVLHKLMPVVLILDWLLIPSATRARWWRPLAWMAYPVAYLAYALVRGAAVGWYPYPFLDPREVGGYAGLVGSAGAVVVGFLAAALVFDQLGRLRRRLRQRRGDGRA